MSFTKRTWAGVVWLALAGGAVVMAAGTANADTGGVQGTGGPESAIGDLTPAGVPVLGVTQAVVGATKVLPGQAGPGY